MRFKSRGERDKFGSRTKKFVELGDIIDLCYAMLAIPKII